MGNEYCMIQRYTPNSSLNSFEVKGNRGTKKRQVNFKGKVSWYILQWSKSNASSKKTLIKMFRTLIAEQ